jgi:uncharacterized protein involved in exopolysaccharide biosynthesis
MENQATVNTDEISLKELIEKLGEWWRYLLSKWLIIGLFSLTSAGLGLLYAFSSKPVYKAVVTFALEDDKQGGGGLSGALGLASSLGFDLGSSAGGAFSGANLMELMKSRKMVEKALLDSIRKGNSATTMADRLLEILEKRKELEEKKIWVGESFYPLGADRTKFTLKQDSILSALYQVVAGEKGILSVAQKDKKVSIIYVEVNTADEIFSKTFAERIVNEVAEFYVETKSRKAKNNVAILQKQADSVRNELNRAITGVAEVSDNTFNLNPALNVNRVPSTKRQIDVQANTAILTQLVTNLELAKVTLLKETPLIQLIDQPILPLKKEKPGKLKSMLLGGLLGLFLSAVFLILKRAYVQLMS